MNAEQHAKVLEAETHIRRVLALAEKSPKINRAVVLGNALDAHLDTVLGALSIMRAVQVGEPQAIRWTLNGDKQCGYNNWLGETPFGRILITWKGWKENQDASVDEFPGDIPAIYGEPEGVKMLAELEFYRRIALSAPPTEHEVKP